MVDLPSVFSIEDSSGTPADVNVTASALPTGAATDASLTNGNQISKVKGGSDGTTIGNVGDRFKVDTGITSGTLVPTITNKLRIRTSVSNINLPNTNAYQTLYTRSGTGLFFGFQADFNSANVNVRLTIDGGVVFTLKIADIKLFQFNDTSTTRMQMGGFLATVGNTLDFSSRFAIPYASTVLLEAAASDSNAHVNNNYIVIQTEDT